MNNSRRHLTRRAPTLSLVYAVVVPILIDGPMVALVGSFSSRVAAGIVGSLSLVVALVVGFSPTA